MAVLPLSNVQYGTVQQRLLETFRQKISIEAGVTLIGNRLTVRFTDPSTENLVEVSAVILDVDTGGPVDRYAPRTWPCTQEEAPKGYCEYDRYVDPQCDSCLHCGEPLERK